MHECSLMKPNDSELTDKPLRLSQSGAATGGIIGAIIGVILFIALIATIALLIRKRRMNRDGPPTYKPPPPKKNTPIYTPVQQENSNGPPDATVAYYETQRTEPVTDLDDGVDDPPKKFDYNTSSVMDESEMLPPYYEFRQMDVDDQHENPSSLSREDSFMSAPMLV